MRSKRIKINIVKWVSNKNLGINKKGGGHEVVVIGKKDGLYRVKTITSLEYTDKKGRRIYSNKKLNDVRKGKILVIPRSKFGTKKTKRFGK